MPAIFSSRYTKVLLSRYTPDPSLYPSGGRETALCWVADTAEPVAGPQVKEHAIGTGAEEEFAAGGPAAEGKLQSRPAVETWSMNVAPATSMCTMRTHREFAATSTYSSTDVVSFKKYVIIF